MTLFSVVIPTTTDGREFTLALRSTWEAAKTHDVEIIVVGDGVTPDVSGFPRTRAITIEKSGISAALNSGVFTSRGEYVVRMDADDICGPRRFEWLRAVIGAQPDVDVIAGSIVKFGESLGLPLWEGPPKSQSEIRDHLLHTGYAIAHPSVAIKRSTLLAVGGYRSEFDGLEDLDLWLRLMGAGASFKGIDRLAVFYRVHPAQTSGSTRHERVACRLAAEQLSQDPCNSAGCPGRLRSFEALHAANWAGVCPRGLGWSIGLRATINLHALPPRLRARLLVANLYRGAVSRGRAVLECRKAGMVDGYSNRVSGRSW